MQKKIVSEKFVLKIKTALAVLTLLHTNHPSFQNMSTITTGASNFHKMRITVLKATFTKSKAKIITHFSCLIKKNLKLILKTL